MKDILGGQTSDQTMPFKQVLKPVEFQFPRDHLAHQVYKTEWWYLSGNVGTDSLGKTEALRKFGYQFTLFRFALHPEKLSQDKSQWRSSNIYMAHVALTDLKNKKVYQYERFSRDGLALAGAGKNDNGYFKFWLNDWHLKTLVTEKLFPLKLAVKNHEFDLNLQLEPIKPLVLQGNQGLSQKSSQHASYYYSYTRLASKGNIRVGNEVYEVSGHSWFDREWSTSSLGEDQQGWDWFALHLDDGSELMLYQMRNKVGLKDSYSSGVLVNAQGESELIQAQQFQLKASEYWQSPVSNIRYPISWEIIIPDKNIKLTVSTTVKQQEWSKAEDFSFNYCEGSIEVSGIKGQHPVSGSGYLEMTGYD
ncbi:MAG: carotenoid 1,2-hydratase [gamma proteobacterium symbiont of Bathyaustriella thionipta]|nr:carotenoid 1,2-hydratase [gamma proteobacterium symbiont of Bathyaustriella thionipta]MCU7949633.1 carotenoid 1,2-hydratase [gamma proteobacterium symbiont of Bathyaustriella thionipta]MCU7952199.1 carotenoid 1,2-hydratase [gamma proteobacterium symbiont of Bathyaustriella thionipta]MCU7956212.1 carotenoid 1,2-hydratase [gamma proteobacterium symbiont of Bathyaustriella thionipta]MCU7966804.1 carotenoid 1,2-hydratase [gamma proteobacterium symbiont of Bathyaustriella thionipta]